MKTLKFLSSVLLVLFALTADAQVSLNVNVGAPPMWGPVGYTDVQYYYIPAVESYYDVNNAMFIYYSDGAWVRRQNLPHRYRNYDLYNGYKVVMVDYRGNAPYANFKQYKQKYGKGYNGGPQKTIGNHPGHNSPKQNHKHNNGGGRGGKKGKGKN